MEKSVKRIPIDSIRLFGIDVLKYYKVPDEAASDVIDVLLTGEARGFASHGLSRLQRIIAGIKSGTHNVDAVPLVHSKGKACYWVDGRMGLGPSVAKYAMNKVIQKAKDYGVCIASARNLTHFGIAGFYTDMAANAGLLGMVLCNTEPAATPFGGAKKVLGTNPISFSCPRIGNPPITIDMATTATSRGKIMECKRKGTSLVDHIAADSFGKMTNNPAMALEGFLLPLGGPFGYKGTALAIMVDILSGALSGASTGKRVEGTITTTDQCSAGYFFMAINPELFCGRENFRKEIEKLIDDIQTSGEGVLIPGEREHRLEREAKELGLIISRSVRKDLLLLGENCGIQCEF